MIPKWVAALLTPTEWCGCETCRKLRASYLKIKRLKVQP